VYHELAITSNPAVDGGSLAKSAISASWRNETNYNDMNSTAKQAG